MIDPTHTDAQPAPTFGGSVLLAKIGATPVVTATASNRRSGNPARGRLRR